MKHHCHCGLGEKIHRLEAKKLGLLGGFLVVLHLLFHVAEALVVPAIILALRGETAAMAEADEPNEIEPVHGAGARGRMLREDFWNSLVDYSPLEAVRTWQMKNDMP